jgi:Fe-S-cluster containining protein
LSKAAAMTAHVLLRDAGLLRQPFPCSQCGLCCQHVDLAAETRFLDGGDGVCRHYDAAGKACTIYAQRPGICRVEQYYDKHYVHLYRWDEFVEMNLKVCAALAAMEVE